ncbi:hypothetical protein QTJ16_004844 [Diplocarpon rosae]|uniref:Zn(2)-C6 fungal-type domain-containing protein n=1 Tax=Diplocarpon rosae TaxID=946125 RepID=A0AAD9WBK4_9HELO|nr:hypothetical protein QTJ16_004844 [Diplocarpon rosae]PBP22438.1 hypothetical protein BUE80_DR006704 [Diplocarpon rosae]
MFSPENTEAAAPPSTSTSTIEASAAEAATASNLQLSEQIPRERRSQEIPHGLNARSCVTCRRRKVKCNKNFPCSNCTRAGSTCVFPAPGRAPRRPRQGGTVVSEREAELLKRLRRLEGVVEELSGQVETDAVKHFPQSEPSLPPKDDDSGDPRNGKSNVVRVVGMDEGAGNRKTWLHRMFRIGNGPYKTAFGLEGLQSGSGRLVVEEGKSHYVASPFWAHVTDELDEIRDLLQQQGFDSDSDTPIAPSDAVTEPNRQSFVLGYVSSDVSLKGLHPLPSQIPFYWQTYLENVNPLVRILHTPTMNKVMKQVQNNLDSLKASTEALVFSIYFATITSMTGEEVRKNLGLGKDVLLKQYRFGVEQALAKAGFLNTQEIVTVQALVLFLICVRRHDDTRFVWSMTGLTLRIAQSLGLHRDGSRFGLTPFDTEMRRRLWWQLFILDVRAAEDHGSDPSILDNRCDTNYPLSINDEDLDPEATEEPAERSGVSDMTFCLIRFEVCTLTQKLTYIPQGPVPSETSMGEMLSLEEKEQMIRECAANLEQKYLQYCDDAGPLYWVTAKIARLIIANMFLVIYYPLTLPGKPSTLSQDIRDRLFMSSIEIIEYSRILESEASIKKWGWLFQTYIQWHAIAFILGELCVRPNSSMVDRAWRAISIIFTDWPATEPHGKTGMLWKPMRKLMAKAARKRQENLNNANVDQDNCLGMPREYTDAHPPQRPDVSTSRYSGQIGNNRQLAEVEPKNNDPSNTMVPANTPALYSNDVSMLPPQVVGMGGFAPDQIQLQIQMQQNNQSARPQTSRLGDNNALLDLDMSAVEGDINWEGWDDLVRDFQIDTDNSQPPDITRGQTLGGMGLWW